MNKGLAIITGATSGIGKEFAFKLAEKGYDLYLIGRRKDILEKNATEIRERYKVDVKLRIMNLNNIEEVNELLKYISRIDTVELLINNAGYGAEASFLKDSFSNQNDMLKVHNEVVIKLCHLIGNKMKEKGHGAIINVSSLAAFNVFPESAMYCSTKRFLVTFSEALAMELDEYGVKVQSLCPGFTRTDFHSKLEMKDSELKNVGIVRWMSTKEVVEYSLRMLEKRLKVIVIPGIWNRLIYNLLKFVPKNIYYRVACKGWKLMKK